jgi:hypothetical protein
VERARDVEVDELEERIGEVGDVRWAAELVR